MQYNGKENNKLIQMMQWCIFRFKKKELPIIQKTDWIL